MKFAKLIALLTLLFAFQFNSRSQVTGNILQINTNNPSGLNVCLNQSTLKIFLENPSPFTLQNVTVNIDMPIGLNYSLGSVSGATILSPTPLNNPTLRIDSLRTGFDTVTIDIEPSCNIIPFLDQGGIPRIYVRIDYTANGIPYYDDFLGNPFIINAPNISITQITNQIYSGKVGDSYQRCISITNGGTGPLSSFNLTNTHGNGISITGISTGTWTTIGNTEEILLNGTHFSAVGDGDNLFETGEVIVICEDVNILNCSNTLTEYFAYWGCNGDTCQSSFETSNAFFPNTVPDIITSVNSSFNNCFDQASEQELTITNNGPGEALNVKVDVFQNTSGINYVSNISSDIDINSLFYINGLGDTIVPFIDSSYDKHVNPIYSCTPSPKGGFIFRIPVVDSGETITIKWNVLNCCKTNCGNKNYNDWRYKISYDNVCGGSYDNGNLGGREFGYTRAKFSDNGNPATMNNGQSGKFSFYIDNLVVGRMSADTNGLFRFVLTKSPCMELTGGLAFTHLNGTTKWHPDSVFDQGDSIVSYFQGPIPANFEKGTFDFNYVINCNSCPGVGGSSAGIGIKAYYTPNINCSCELQIACETIIPTIIYCPSGDCPFALTNYTFERLNFGNPDYNEDGIPDSNISAHKDSVHKHKAIYGDTIITVAVGSVQTLSYWNYLFAESHLSNANYLSFLNADLTIFDSLGNTHIYNNITPTITPTPGNNQEIFFNFSVDTLSAIGTLPPTYKFNIHDSIVLVIKYLAENNTSGNIKYITNNFKLYVSDTAFPTHDSLKIICNPQIGNILNINHYTTIAGGGAYKLNSCDQRLIRKAYYFSVGPCCNNYAGGNLFRREYRHFSKLSTIGLKLPAGYNVISSSIAEMRTAGTGSHAWSPTININPYYASNDSLIFKVDTLLYDAFGGPALHSDEGFAGLLDVVIEPTCAVIPDTAITVNYWTTHSQNFNGIPRTEDKVNSYTSLHYNYPRLKVQSTNPSLVAPNRTITWTVLVDNLSNVSHAPNLWFKKGNISGVNILNIYDLKNNVYLNQNSGGFFLSDTVYEMENRRFEITADFTNCNTDSIKILIGWSCENHPDSISEINCDPLEIRLDVTPLLGALETKLISQPDTIDLCDTVTYVIEAESIQRGTVYGLNLKASIPSGLTILAGSSYLSLFDTNNFINIPDPLNTLGSIWQWNLDSASQYLDTIGLTGILDTTINKVYVKFKVLTDCQFTSGNIIGVGYDGISPCGRPTNLSSIGTKPLYVRDATPSYNTTIKINTTYLTPCLANTYVEVTVINNGPDTTLGQDSVLLQLPSSINYVNGSFVSLYNAPGNTGVQTTNGTFNYVKWPLTNGINVGDSSVFGFEIDANPDLVGCSVFPIRVSSESSSGAFCTSTSSYCNINLVVKDTIKNVFTYKGYLNIINDSSYTVFNPPNGEIGYINFDILNTGEDINASINTIVNYYIDFDGNGVYSSLDIWIANDTINKLLPNLDTVNFKDTIDIASGSSCRILAVIDTSDNPCTCIPSQSQINTPIINDLNDTVICANSSFKIGIDSVNGYTYSWNTSAYLSDSTISDPIFTYPPSNLNDTLTYILTTDRIYCFHHDTIQIIIHGEPVAITGPDQNLCDIYNSILVGNIPQQYWNGKWILASGPNTPNIVDDTLYNSPVNNLIEGQYLFTWNMWNDSCPVAIDTMIINVFDPPIANAGPDRAICDSTTINLGAIQPVGTSNGKWVLLSGPNIPSIINDSLHNTPITNLIEGAYYFIWTVSNGNCPPVSDTVFIHIYNQPLSNAGPDQNLCDQYITSLTANNLSGSAKGHWNLVSGPNTPILSNDSIPNPNLSGLIEGSYIFSWTVNNGNCPPKIDSVTINVFNSPNANAGPNQNLCNQYATTLNGNLPIGSAVGKWMLISGPNTPLLADSSLYNSSLSGLIEGSYLFSWTVSNGVCPPAMDTLIINVFDPPTALAGPNQDLCNQYVTNLIGNIVAGSSNGIWTFLSSTNATVPLITNDTIPNTLVSSLQEGSYLFSWTVSNGVCPSVSDSLTINIYDPVTADAGPDQDLCNQYQTILTGNVPQGSAQGIWSVLSGPNLITLTDSSQYNTSASGLIEGTYTLIWTVSNGNCPTAADTLIINVYDPPTANAGPDQDLCDKSTTNLNANIVTGSSSGFWSVLSGPNIPNIANPNSNHSAITNLVEGIYTLIWTVSNGNCPPSVDTMQIRVYNSPLANVGPDQNLCLNTSAIISANTPLGTSSGSWSLLNSPNIPVIADSISNNTGVSNLIKGHYQFLWTVTNGVCPNAYDTLNVFNNPIPQVNFASNTNVICEQECIELTNNSIIDFPDSIVRYLWEFSDGQKSTQREPTICFNSAGVYSIKLIAISNNGCRDSINMDNYIDVYPLPTAYFELNPQYNVLTYDMIQVIDGSQDADLYYYDFGNGNTSTLQNPNVFYEDSGTYTVTQIVETFFGCKDTFMRPISINPDLIIYVPNTFTPDRDNKNDIFRPSLYGVEPESYRFLVFNRWGQLIFETRNTDIGWDGTYLGLKSKTDTYVWKVEVKGGHSRGAKTLIGHVNLLR